MKKRNSQSILFLLVLFLLCYSHFLFGQQNIRQLTDWKYIQQGKDWFTFNSGRQGDLVDTNHIIVRLKSKGDIKEFNFQIEGLPTLKDNSGSYADGFYELELPIGTDHFKIAKKMEMTNKFEYVYFNTFVRINSSDPLFSNQWNLQKINATQAWNISTGSTSIIVAIIDNGCDYNHEDLISNLWSGIGYDKLSNDSDPSVVPYNDGDYHGTAVAGVIGATTNNAYGIAGLAGGWSGANGIRMMHLRAGYGDLIDHSAAAQSIDWARTHGAKVINMSWGGGQPYTDLETAINNATNAGCICVASAGNYRKKYS